MRIAGRSVSTNRASRRIPSRTEMLPYARFSRGMSMSAAFHLGGKGFFVRTREFQTVMLRRQLADGAEFRARSLGHQEVRLSARL
jgi:hypothetical protein